MTAEEKFHLVAFPSLGNDVSQGNSHGSQLISSLPVMHLPDISWGEASVGCLPRSYHDSLDTISGTTPMKTFPRYTPHPHLTPLPFIISPSLLPLYLGLFLRFPFPNSHSVILSSSPSHLIVIIFVSILSSISFSSFILLSCLFPLSLSHLLSVFFGDGCLSEHILSWFQQLSSMSHLCPTTHLILGPSWTLEFQTHLPL